MKNLLFFLGGFLFITLAVLVPEFAQAAATDPLTIGEADRMAKETNTIIATSAGALAFFLGWVAGVST